LPREFRTRLMDFGLARRDQADVTMTVEGQILGTPAYMSPEQARGEIQQTDSRTDIYSLGVMLYELLTGERPFRGSSRMLIQQVIHDPAPSLRKLNGNISRDLETITLRCMEKSPSARYQTATELVEDLRRWLNNQPIHARPVGNLERATRWCARNPTTAGLSSALFVSMICGLALVTWKWREAEHQREVAETKQIEAERTSDAANRVQQIYNNVLEQSAVQRADPDQRITMRELLDAASREVHNRFVGDDVVKGSVLRTLGETYSWMRIYDEAEKLIREGLQLHRQELGDGDALTVRSESSLAAVLRWQRRLDEAQPLFEHAIEAQTQLSGPTSDATLSLRNQLSELLREKGETQAALNIQESLYADYVRTMGRDTRDSLTSANNLAGLYYEMGNKEAAAKMFRTVWKSRERMLGERHEETRIAVNNLGVVLKQLNRLDEAEVCYRIALEGDTAVLGPDHPSTLTDVHNLAGLLTARGKLDEAIEMYKELIPKRRGALAPEHPLVATSLTGLAGAQRSRQQLAEAEASLREAIRIRRKSLSAGHWQTADTEGELGELLVEVGRFAEAEQILLESYEQLRTNTEIPAFRVESAVGRLVELYEEWDKPAQRKTWQERLQSY
jgi:eukaryotic-like serine/threonine-protein kinase